MNRHFPKTINNHQVSNRYKKNRETSFSRDHQQFQVFSIVFIYEGEHQREAKELLATLPLRLCPRSSHLGRYSPCPEWKSGKKRKWVLHDSPACLGTSALLTTKMASIFFSFFILFFNIFWYCWGRVSFFLSIFYILCILLLAVLFFFLLIYFLCLFIGISIVFHSQSIRNIRHVSYIKFSI